MSIREINKKINFIKEQKKEKIENFIQSYFQDVKV